MKKFKTILSSILALVLIAGFGCATLDTYPINLQDKVDIQKSESNEILSPQLSALSSLQSDERKVIGNVQFALYDAQGKLKDYREYRNLVVSAGKAGTASRINGAGAEAAFTYIGIGIGTTSPAAGNTTLESEITTGGGARASATCTRVTVTVTDDTAQLQVTFAFTSGFTVTESGVLNAASTGTLLARKTFSAINVANGDSLQVTWKFTVS